MAVTLINVFNVPEDKIDAFLTEWRKTSAFFKANAPGFIETHLHRNTGTGNQTFQFVNIARWTSGEAWKESHDLYKPTEYALEGVKGHPAIFQDIINLEKNTEGEGRPINWVAS